MQKHTVKPFIKWAGGKGQLLEVLNAHYPDKLASGKIKNYVEAFVGGGAVLFDVLQRFPIEAAVIIDINKELINCYQCIKHNSHDLIEKLLKLQDTYTFLDENSQIKFFLDVREKYNSIKLNGIYDYDKAADFIFLNKTCYNGLYRVNSCGEFNVPFGRYKNPRICDRENLLLASRLLQKVEILHGDYSLCRHYANENTFIYFDPPYRPVTNTQSFVNYSKYGFDDNNQKALAKMISDLDRVGCNILLSNSDPKNTNPLDDFFDELYSDFVIDRIKARRMINCQAEKRGNVTEIIVKNY